MNAFTIPAKSNFGKKLMTDAGRARQSPKTHQPIVLPNSSKFPAPKLMEKK